MVVMTTSENNVCRTVNVLNTNKRYRFLLQCDKIIIKKPTTITHKPKSKKPEAFRDK